MRLNENVEQVMAMDPEVILMAVLLPGLPDSAPLYRKLREVAPRYRSAGLGIRFLLRYDGACELLSSPSFGVAQIATYESDPRYDRSAFLQAAGDMLAFTNPPKHTRLRGLMSRAFTPRSVERLAPRIDQLSRSHLERCAQMGTFDVVGEVGSVLPGEVICDMLGVPHEDRPQMGRWTRDIIAILAPTLPDDVLGAADRGVLEAQAYLEGLIAQSSQATAGRPHHPSGGGVASGRPPQRPGGGELLSHPADAGTDTTVNLIGTGTLLLLQHRDEHKKPRATPSLIRSAVEELLRFEPPAQMTASGWQPSRP